MSDPFVSQAAPAPAELVRRQVKRLLAASPAYAQLAPDMQHRIATGMAGVSAYLAHPEGIAADRLAGALAAIPARNVAGRAGDLLDDVDFPAFVAGLIEGVFQSIVTASIQQMEAYADLLDKVAGTVARFARDNVTDGDGRDWLAASYPDYFERDSASGGLRLRSGIDGEEALRRLHFLPLECELKRLDPADIEKKLVPAARRRIVAARQQLLGSMVLMGINRIVVTDGRIGSKLGAAAGE